MRDAGDPDDTMARPAPLRTTGSMPGGFVQERT